MHAWLIIPTWDPRRRGDDFNLHGMLHCRLSPCAFNKLEAHIVFPSGIWCLLTTPFFCLQGTILVLDLSFKTEMYAEQSSGKTPNIH